MNSSDLERVIRGISSKHIHHVATGWHPGQDLLNVTLVDHELYSTVQVSGLELVQIRTEQEGLMLAVGLSRKALLGLADKHTAVGADIRKFALGL